MTMRTRDGEQKKRMKERNRYERKQNRKLRTADEEKKSSYTEHRKKVITFLERQ